MKKLATIGSAALLLGLAIAPSLAMAAGELPTIPTSGVNSYDAVWSLICRVVRILFTLFFILAIVFVLYAAFLYLTAGGDAGKVSTASKMLLYAAIAIVVALIAYNFPTIVGHFIGGGSGLQNVC